MNIDQFAEEDGRVVREYGYGDDVVIAADLGPSVADADVDVLADTAIVVTGAGEGEPRIELDLPEGDAEVFIKNGVLTIELKEEA